jgi:nitrite reductase/ring-hydroxylating ferredoxin subunit
VEHDLVGKLASTFPDHAQMSRHVVAGVAEIAPGACKLVIAKGREIGMFNVGGRFYALANRCPHKGGPLCHGHITGLAQSGSPGDYRLTRNGEFLRCPWHGWEFEIATGQSYCDPQTMRIRQFEVTVTSGDALVKGPYIAESFPVSVEQDYLVVEI